MNHVRIYSSYIVRSLRSCGICFLLLLCCFSPVKAEITIGEYGNTFGDNVSGLISQFGLGEASSTPSGVQYNGSYFRYRVVSSDSSLTPSLSDGNSLHVPVNVIYTHDGSTPFTLFFYDREVFSSAYVYVCVDNSSDGLIWTQRGQIFLNSSYTFNDSGVTGKNIFYGSTNSSYGYWGNAFSYSIFRSSTGDIPFVHAGVSTVLAVMSSNSEYWPWKGTTSSGGRSWADGTQLDGDNTSRYSQVFIVMDSNDDNSVSQEEVNFYNYTYNTNYDYSVFNESNNFDEDQFLYWVAKQIEVGVENPGGGTGSGGGSGSVTGGITVTDSFTQTQTQTIEENAVNVTVNNNNSLTQENYQELNSLINNYNGSSEDETDPFQQAIGNFQAFHAIALAFAGLASVVFGWLPWWVTALLGAMFSMVCVFIVLRLIHLFK